MKNKTVLSFGLLVLILLNAVSLFYWIKKDTRPTAWDESIHTRVAFDYKDRLAKGDIMSMLKPAYFNYPPLYHYMVAAVLGKTSQVSDAGAVVNVVGTTLLIIIIFLLGAEFMDSGAGFVAATLFVCYPLIAYMQRITMIDLWLTAWVALSFYCLVKSNSFENVLWSAAFGLTLACAMLTKWTALAYVLLPLSIATWTSLRQKRWKSLLLAGLVFIVVAGPWYVINFFPMLSHVNHFAGLKPAGGMMLSGWKNVFWYALSLSDQSRWLAFLLVPGLIAVFWRPKLWPVLLWFIGSYILFSLISNKNERYLMPALPAMALLSVSWLPSQRRWPYVVVLALGLFVAFKKYDPPRAEDWKHAEIINTVVRLKKDPKEFTRVVVVSNAAYFHSNSFNVDVKAMGINNVDFKGVPQKRWFEFAEFVLSKTGDVGPAISAGSIAAPVHFMETPAPWFKEIYQEKAKWVLPDGSEAVLYQQMVHPQHVGDQGLFNLTLDEMQVPNITAKGVAVKAIPESKEKTAVGLLRELSVRCTSCLYKGIELKNISVRLIRPQVNLPLFLETQQIELLSLGRMKPSAELEAATVLALARTKAKWLKDPVLNLENGRLTVGGAAFGAVPLHVVLQATVKNGFFETKAESVSIAGVPMPTILFSSLLNRSISLSPNADMLYYLDIGSLNEEGGRLKIAASQ